ncbi:MutS-related protein [Anaeromicropila herbilytica]|uniref:Mannonate oxidoreductase n=1 Tax=Anaeromicropila herbilytica TaxID=2785025 RepID=A0A7R7EJC8_9FIRM|nr:DNA mismatch repair protein MutS [Anaeromicropila herbilytica]BCN29906.1 mannonate oxidoreductase [Anaeromicropila herbilytica]
MDYYSKALKVIDKEKKEVSKQYRLISNIRLFVSVVGILFFVLSIIDQNMIYFAIFLGSSVLFVGFVVYHDKIRERKEYTDAKEKVLLKQVDRRNSKWSSFEETGIEFCKEDMTIEKDLDLLGRNSLYQYICTCNTIEGKRFLFTYLKEDNIDRKKIYKKQNAVKEFLENEELALEFETRSMMVGMKIGPKQNAWYESFLEYLFMKESLLATFFQQVSFILPICNAIAFVLFLKGNINIYIPFTLTFLQLCLAYYISFRCKDIISKVFRFCSHIGEYYRFIQYIENVEFSSVYLKELKSKISNDYKTTKGIQKLDHINEAFLIHTNPYIHIFLQMFLMYDLHCIRLLEQWKKSYADSMVIIFKVIGEMEALESLSVIGRDREISFPILKESEDIIFHGSDMTHPLIQADQAVKNSIHIEHGIEIITGSNMSGKTTFLRTIGMNMVLAYAGAPVCASRMELSVMNLFTSMRVQDDVSKGVSSFYAEVLRIKEMVEYAKNHKPMLALIDEIFKGTNSADRITGAKEILKYLNKRHVIAVVSTHDFELCSLVENNEVVGSNHHFEEYYDSDQIHFDYKMKKGRGYTTNAKYILRMAGLINK